MVIFAQHFTEDIRHIILFLMTERNLNPCSWWIHKTLTPTGVPIFPKYRLIGERKIIKQNNLTSHYSKCFWFFFYGFGIHLDYLVGSCVRKTRLPTCTIFLSPAMTKSLTRIDVKENCFISSSTLVKGLQAIMAKGSRQQEFEAPGPQSGCKDQWALVLSSPPFY